MTPPPTDHRRATAERNVEAILDAVERLLARREQPTISAVAVEARLSRPTVYAHFPDRKQMLAAVVRRAVDRWSRAAEAIQADRGAPDDALRRLVALGWEEISRSSHIADAASAELGADATASSHDSGRQVVRRLAERGRRDGTFRRDVPIEWLISAFFALIHAAHDDVGAGKLAPRAALEALLATLPDVFAGPSRSDGTAAGDEPS